MMKKTIFAVATILTLAGCSSGDHEELDAWMIQVKSAPGGRIEPVPTFAAYKPFDYSAVSLRAPFDKPVIVKPEDGLGMSANVDAPSATRAKELLEMVNIESMTMVGSLEKDGQLWALLGDADGNVHYVKDGNYVGKNNGRIVFTSPTYIQIVEVISNGGNGWVERPRVLELRENK